MITLEKYFNNDQIRMDIFRSKYLLHVDQGVDECFNNIASEIASVSIEDDKDTWIDFWTQTLIDGIWRPGGSIIAGVNNPDKKISLFNCTTFVIEEDTLNSIYATRSEAAEAAAHRQGLGVEFSNVRPKNSIVNNSAEVSEGVINWMKSYNYLAEEVGQKGRKPAILGSLKIHHLDIEEFITVKSDLDTLKNMNISVQITNDFMECVKIDGDWELYFDFKDDPTKERITRTVKAKYLFDLICKQSHEFAEPGLQFIDYMKNFSIQEALGYEITSTNACSEKSLPNRGVCALASFNMGAIPAIDDPTFHVQFQKLVYSLVRFMDNVVQYEIEHPYKSPIEKQLEVVKDLREIGLGVTNLHQWVYNQGCAYDSDTGIEIMNELFKWYQYYAFKASCTLAIDRGPCPAWTRCKENGTLKETEFLKGIFEEFPELKEYFYTTGIRNGALLSVAPTGSISFTFPEDCLSSGIEPLIGYSYWRKTRAISRGEYDYYFVLPTSIKNIILTKMNNSFESVDIDDYNIIKNFSGSVLDQDGEIGKKVIKIVDEWANIELLKPAYEIDPFKKMTMMGKIQKWIDAAISVTYNLPYDFPVEKIGDLYIQAYKEKLKALSIYREGSREGILIFEDPITHKNKYNKDQKPVARCSDKNRPLEIIFNCSPNRPKELPCEIHHCTVKGEQWIVLVGMLKDSPYELFAGLKNEDFNISKTIKEGTVIKNTNGYTLRINSRNTYIDYNDITKLFMNVEFEALTRMISLALCHGVYHEVIVKQLKKSSEFIGDFMAVVSRVLNKYIKDGAFISENSKCPVCGDILIHNGGCIECSSCDYSKCG